MKKITAALIAAVIAILSMNTAAFAEPDSQYIASEKPMGDVNRNGKFDSKDVFQLRKYLAKFGGISISYENSDFNGDTKVDSKDVLAMRKKLAQWKISASTQFAAEDEDITAKLTDLGIASYSTRSDSDGEAMIYSRNPYDMASYGGRVVISSGNYRDNLGPVDINYVTRDSDKIRTMRPSLKTEQVSRFYEFDGKLYALGIDPVAWATGEFYEYSSDRKIWYTYNTLKDNIHLYDMVKHNGKFFFCGSNVKYIDGEECSIGAVFRFDGDSFEGSKKEQYTELEFIDRWGEKIEPITIIGVPRVYEMVEFRGELYALYYDSVLHENLRSHDEKLDKSGVYKYDEKSEKMIYCDGLSMFEPLEYSDIYIQDETCIKHDFEWNGKYYFINNALFETEDLATYNMVKIDGYEDYIIRDCLVINDKAYILANVKKSGGGWENGVFETTNFKEWRRILHYDSPTYTKSFEYCDGAFYFGLGTDRKYAKTAAGKNCGRIYRYCYYK